MFSVQQIVFPAFVKMTVQLDASLSFFWPGQHRIMHHYKAGSLKGCGCKIMNFFKQLRFVFFVMISADQNLSSVQLRNHPACLFDRKIVAEVSKQIDFIRFSYDRVIIFYQEFVHFLYTAKRALFDFNDAWMAKMQIACEIYHMILLFRVESLCA